jgi:hypothetical protein
MPVRVSLPQRSEALHLICDGIAERIADQKFAVRSLVTLYRNSRNIGRPDTLGAAASASPASQSTSKLFKAALKGVRTAATHTTTVFGMAASEMAGRCGLFGSSVE